MNDRDREWAEFMALRKADSTSGLPDALPLTPQQIEDLELDSTLSALGRIANDTDFVNDVMERVDTSKLEASSDHFRTPLPTLDPNFEISPVPVLEFISDEDDENDASVPEKRLATVKPKNLSRDFQTESEPSLVSARERMILFAGCLIVAAISAYFLIPDQPTSPQQTVKSPELPASEILAQTEDSDDPTDSEGLVVDQSNKSQSLLPVYSPADPDTKLRTPPTELDQVAVQESPDIDEPETPETKSQRRIPPFAFRNRPAPRERPAPRKLTKAEVEQRKQIIQSDKKWDLVLSLDPSGHGALSINNQLISNDVLVIHSRDVIRGIGSETAKRLAFLQPRIGKQIGGSVTIWNMKYDFESPAEIEQAVEQAIGQLKENWPQRDRLRQVHEKLTLEHANSVQTKAEAKKRRLNRLLGNPAPITRGSGAIEAPQPAPTPPIPAQQLVRQKRIRQSLFATQQYFPSSDAMAVFENSITRTETFLRELAKDRLVWDTSVRRGSVAQHEVISLRQSQDALDRTTRIQMNQDDFRAFALNQRELNLPVEVHGVSTLPLIQHLSAVELKTQLRENTRSYDLFANVDAFKSAIRFVESNLKRTRANSQPFEPLEGILASRPDLKGLPLVLGDDCHLSEQDARIQSSVSSSMGGALQKFDSFGNRDIKNDRLLRTLAVSAAIDKCCESGYENPTQALTTLDQMMQIDHTYLVLNVIENLRSASTDTGIKLIAKRAKFDLRPEVRLSATHALKEFPKEKYRDILMEGFEYPWYVVAQHSAEALVRLDDKQAVPELVELLKQNKSLASFEEDGKFFQREVVAVNHLRNCLLCHAPSTSLDDRSRGKVPDWEHELPREYYQSKVGTFVRADITYLTQDFSVMQPVEASGPWPKDQRFDYMVYKRPTSEMVAQQPSAMKQNKIHRQAIIFALQSLTGKNPQDNSWKTWSRIADDMP